MFSFLMRKDPLTRVIEKYRQDGPVNDFVRVLLANKTCDIINQGLKQAKGKIENHF